MSLIGNVIKLGRRIGVNSPRAGNDAMETDAAQAQTLNRPKGKPFQVVPTDIRRKSRKANSRG